ncbi:hypothetical protein GCM10027594_01200 [Hymenobacter agri]
MREATIALRDYRIRHVVKVVERNGSAGQRFAVGAAADERIEPRLVRNHYLTVGRNNDVQF